MSEYDTWRWMATIGTMTEVSGGRMQATSPSLSRSTPKAGWAVGWFVGGEGGGRGRGSVGVGGREGCGKMDTPFDADWEGVCVCGGDFGPDKRLSMQMRSRSWQQAPTHSLSKTRQVMVPITALMGDDRLVPERYDKQKRESMSHQPMHVHVNGPPGSPTVSPQSQCHQEVMPTTPTPTHPPVRSVSFTTA